MNKTAQLLFVNAVGKGKALHERITGILRRYREDVKKAEEESSRYKDEQQELAARKAPLVEKYKAQVTVSCQEYAKELRETSNKLHRELRQHLMGNVDPAFKTTLDLYREYSMKPSQEELYALLEMNNGNSAGLRALAGVLDQTQAKLKLKFRTPDEFCADLQKIDRLAAELEHHPYIPLDYTHEGLELFGKDHIVMTREDGSTYENGNTYDFYTLNASRALCESTIEEMETAKKYWAADVSYELQDRLTAEREEEAARQRELAELKGEEPPKPEDKGETSVEVEDISKASELLDKMINDARSARKAAENIKEYMR